MSVDRRFESMFAELAQIRATARIGDDDAPLKQGGPGGTSGGVTDDWKADVERRLGQLHSDVRNLLYFGIALAALIGGLYFYFNTKFEAVNQRLAMIETQQARDSATMNGKLDMLLDRKSEGKPRQ